MADQKEIMDDTERADIKETDVEKTDIEGTFEQLDELIRSLEGETLSMEESFAAYAKGLMLIRRCQESIDEVEKKVLVLEESGEQHEF